MPEIVKETKSGHVAGSFATIPRGILLHGSRGGAATLGAEYRGTSTWAANPSHDLGWNATIGEHRYCTHMTARQWGWNAREHSSFYLAVEFAQPTVNDAITDAQVAAFVAWWRADVLPVWPAMTVSRTPLPTHSEMPAGIRDGKTDTFPQGDSRNDQLRERIRTAMSASPGDEDAQLEAEYQRNRLQLGNKRFKALIDRPYHKGPVLVCQYGWCGVDPVTTRVIDQGGMDDLVFYLESNNVLTRV
jgi:hypothetical protein